MADPLGPRLTLFEQQVLAKLDTIIANQGASNGPVLAAMEDHLRYLRLTDMRRFGLVTDPAALPPATVEQP